jgi:hypothetical protein
MPLGTEQLYTIVKSKQVHIFESPKPLILKPTASRFLNVQEPRPFSLPPPDHLSARSGSTLAILAYQPHEKRGSAELSI